MKKILFLWSTSFWDRIASIPYLLKMKKEWNKVYLLEYWKWYVNYLHKQSDIYKLYKDNDLYEDLFIIPYNKIELIRFIIKNLFKFDLAYAPTYTHANRLRWFLFWKHRKYTFKSLNDNTKYDNFVSGMLEQKNVWFSSYSKELKIPYDISYREKFWINESFVTIFVWPYTWSLKIEEREEIFNYINSKRLKIIFLWWSSENREWWIERYIGNKDYIINLLWKTDFEELCSIIKDANYTISANGWIMRLSHFLNPKSISFSIVSGNMIHPPYDNKLNFHIRKKVCPLPCEMRVSEKDYKKYWYRKCLYHWTGKEWLCKDLKWDKIIEKIKELIKK